MAESTSEIIRILDSHSPEQIAEFLAYQTKGRNRSKAGYNFYQTYSDQQPHERKARINEIYTFLISEQGKRDLQRIIEKRDHSF
jgi:hypothetical protein